MLHFSAQSEYRVTNCYCMVRRQQHIFSVHTEYGKKNCQQILSIQQKYTQVLVFCQCSLRIGYQLVAHFKHSVTIVIILYTCSNKLLCLLFILWHHSLQTPFSDSSRRSIFKSWTECIIDYKSPFNGITPQMINYLCTRDPYYALYTALLIS